MPTHLPDTGKEWVYIIKTELLQSSWFSCFYNKKKEKKTGMKFYLTLLTGR